MAATPEVRAKNRIKKAMMEIIEQRKLPHKIYWNAGTGFGPARLDCDGVIAGHPFALEVKRFDGKGVLRTRQKVNLAEYAAAGACSRLIDNEVSLELFLTWIATLEPRTT